MTQQLRLIYPDTIIWNLLCDQNIVPRELLDSLSAKGFTLVVSFHTVYELARNFERDDAAGNARGRQLFSYLKQYLDLDIPSTKQLWELIMDEAFRKNLSVIDPLATSQESATEKREVEKLADGIVEGPVKMFLEKRRQFARGTKAQQAARIIESEKLREYLRAISEDELATWMPKETRGAKIAVVGAGGGGSHVIQQLAYLGLGEIVVIDPDVYENSNRHRLVSGLRADIGSPKVDIFHRLVRKIGLGGRVQRVRAAIPDSGAIEALRGCDVIVGCVDTLFARSDLQEIASRYLIPYVDIGATVRPVPDALENDPRIAVAGNVVTYVPGSFCLWCCGFLSREKIEAEQNGPTRAYFEKNTQEAQVVSFNGLLASQAVTEVLQLLTSFRGVGLRNMDLRMPGTATVRGYKKFDGVTRSLQEWGGVRRPNCSHCERDLGAGDVVLSAIPAEHTTAA